MITGSIVTVRIHFWPSKLGPMSRLVAVFNHPNPSPKQIVAGFQEANDAVGDGPINSPLKAKILDGDYQTDEILIHEMKKKLRLFKKGTRSCPLCLMVNIKNGEDHIHDGVNY